MDEEVVRYKQVSGTLEEKKQQFKKQLDKFSKDAQKGKVLCLTDLLINAEDIYIEELD